jgi:hypothetical protein
VPSLLIRKKAGKLEKNAAKEESAYFERRHFFPLRVNFRFLQNLAKAQAIDFDSRQWRCTARRNSLKDFSVFSVDKTYQDI